jgi:hypothetical protein
MHEIRLGHELRTLLTDQRPSCRSPGLAFESMDRHGSAAVVMPVGVCSAGCDNAMHVVSAGTLK